jgi:3-oxoacyl-[acyl-carrier protein] reductase
MEYGLKNKVALVAASSRGLGKAVAWALAREGTKLVICARNKKTLEETADEILMETGVTVFPLAMDLSDPERIDWLVTETMDLFGKVDILVTNAGGPPSGSLDELDDNQWKKSIDLTLMSVVRLTKAVIPAMKEQNWGRIIHMASVTVKQPVPGMLLSNTIRPAVIGFSKSIAEEVAGYQITVNAVCPGHFSTNRLRELMENKAQQSNISVKQIENELIDQVPLRRIGDPEEFGNLVAFLASEKAGYLTGATIQIDGGYVKGII